jgi:hypothetical protein
MSRIVPRKAVEPEEEIVTESNFKLAYPVLYQQIFERGRLAGYSEALEKARGEGARSIKAAAVAGDTGEDKETAKRRLVDEYQKAHPEASVKDAILAVGKAHRELFR